MSICRGTAIIYLFTDSDVFFYLTFLTQSICHDDSLATLSPFPADRFFTTQIFGGHVTRFNQGLSLDDKGGEEREPGFEAKTILGKKSYCN